MPPFLSSAIAQESGLAPWVVLVRLLLALLLGWIIAWIYRRSTSELEPGSSFPLTLVLLCVLIAMVTQVIGDNIARAFSLVGALSIVRFRTVVRDTRDTAFVIFAVIVGMAVGAAHLWVALLGLAVVGLATVVPTFGERARIDEHAWELRLRVALGQDPEQLAGATLNQFALRHVLVGVASDRSGAALDYSYQLSLRPGQGMDALVRALGLVEGIQELRCNRGEGDGR
ncbi:MAG TPA: DUF4956 domain-containing protein [Steroidobacteraceae bacterium]|nr:DUF4956 domain-containing protein [Steroidobacteraceae bacterium]